MSRLICASRRVPALIGNAEGGRGSILFGQREAHVTPTGRPPSRWWVLSVAAGLLACATLLVIPVDSGAWVVVARLTGATAVVVFGWAVFRMPPRTRIVWLLMWSYAALTVVADVMYDVQQRLLDDPPFPGPADVLYLGAYVAAIGGLLILVRRVFPGGDRDAWIDTTIITVAAAAVIGYVVARPTILHSEQSGLALLIVLAYPFLDIVVLAGLTRLLIGGARTTIATSLLAIGFLTTLSADLFYNVVVSNGVDDFSPPLLDALYLAAIVIMAAAAWAPDADLVDNPAERLPSPDRSFRLVGLAIGMLAIPVLLVFVAWDDVAIRRLSIASIGVLLLVTWRLERVLRTVRAQNTLLGREARTDALTGLPNRRTLDYEVERLVESSILTGEPLTVAMLDLDHFKSFNDENGHQAGDRLLATCARAWRASLPSSAFLARYGGEEFALLLPGVGRDDAPALLERLRAAMPTQRTVSIGYAVREADEAGSAVIWRADVALYEAKDRGRDRIIPAW